MRAINLRAILQRTVSDVYGDLVTRRTGAAVRGGIEQELEDSDGEPTLIDFSAVRCLDLSCADEIVAKLVLQYGNWRFVLRCVSPAQRDALEPVLERHGLAVALVEHTGKVELIGPDTEAEVLLGKLLAYGLVAESDGSRTLLA